MKTLYISDLDGTLLNNKAEISEFTKYNLNKLISEGVCFSIATARTSATVVKMLEGIDFKIPVILMNGVCTYDFANNKYIRVQAIPDSIKRCMINIIAKNELSGFLYTIDGDILSTFYENTFSPNAKAFIDERVRKYGKIFSKVDSFNRCLDKTIVYFSVSDKKERLETVYNELKVVNDLNIEFYRDIYNKDYWYLEVSSSNASKYIAVKELRKEYAFDRVIGFGDNLNDLPLFEACDECYAVLNAKMEVKEKASGVISSNDNDAVIKWMIANT